MSSLWTDEEMLTALHLRDREFLSAAKIAKRLNRSRSAVLGLFHRIEHETDFADVSPHLNGTMPERWWKR